MGFLRKIFRKYIWLPLFVFFLQKKMSKIQTMGAIQTVQYLLNSNSSCVRFVDSYRNGSSGLSESF